MKKSITILIATIGVLSLMSFGLLNDDGKSGRTTSGCGSCHGSSATSSVNISLAFSPSVTGGYIANTAYAVTATVAHSGESLAGLDLSASSGTLASGSNTKILSSEIVHTGNDNTASSGSVDFHFTWTAPASGNVTFDYAALAGNGDGSTSGDYWNLGSTSLSPTTVGIEEYISAGININVFPNPVKESACISYVLAENSFVSAGLVNTEGQTVAALFENEAQAAGKQNRILNLPASIAKGIYFAEIRVNGKNNYVKILVQ